MRYTTQKAALCAALLEGRILTIMEAFIELGITNLPREIVRSVERAFGVTINKHKKRNINMFGEEGYCFVYRLTGDKESLYNISKAKRPAHRKGLKLMKLYVDEHTYESECNNCGKHGFDVIYRSDYDEHLCESCFDDFEYGIEWND